MGHPSLIFIVVFCRFIRILFFTRVKPFFITFVSSRYSGCEFKLLFHNVVVSSLTFGRSWVYRPLGSDQVLRFRSRYLVCE